LPSKHKALWVQTQVPPKPRNNQKPKELSRKNPLLLRAGAVSWWAHPLPPASGREHRASEQPLLPSLLSLGMLTIERKALIVLYPHVANIPLYNWIFRNFSSAASELAQSGQLIDLWLQRGYRLPTSTSLDQGENMYNECSQNKISCCNFPALINIFK
jgi:hypothetical protein